jgi:hypothetical protein
MRAFALHHRKRKMNIVLQNKSHRGFIADETGSWTPSSEKARVFPNCLNALLFCFDRRLPNMQIFAMFKNPEFNFVMPVTDDLGA